MNIGAFLKVSYNDYPGKIASVIFTNACNMACPYCHNGELAKGQARLLDVDEILRRLKNRSKFVNALVISGGEPTLQLDLQAFVKKVKALGLKVKLDTNGLKPEVTENLIAAGLLDYVALDLKWHPDDYGHFIIDRKLKMNASERLYKSIDLLGRSKIPFEVRTTVLKPYHSQEMLERLYEIAVGADSITWQQYRMTDTQYENTFFETYTKEELILMKKALESSCPITIRSSH